MIQSICTDTDTRLEATFLLRVARAYLAHDVTTCPAEAVDLAGHVWRASAAAEVMALNAIATEEPHTRAAADMVHHAAIVMTGAGVA